MTDGAPDTVNAAAPTTIEEIGDAIRGAPAGAGRLRIAGGGCVAIPPRDGGLRLTTTRCRGIVAIRPDDLTATVRAGTPLQELDAALRAAGRRLPMRSWAPDPRATIGGAIAAGADGIVAREGFRWRDAVLGVTAVLGTGAVVRVGASVVKSVAGYDVPKLLVGSRGTFAVIAELTVRIEGIPQVSAAIQLRDCAPDQVASNVANLVALPHAPVGLVMTPGVAAGTVTIDCLFEGRNRAIRAAIGGLPRGAWTEVADAGARWDALTAAASAPPPSGLVRRVAAARPEWPFTPALPTRSGGWLVDVLRGRATWVSAPPTAPNDDPSAAVRDRIRAAFDPEHRFQPGRGWGAA